MSNREKSDDIAGVEFAGVEFVGVESAGSEWGGVGGRPTLSPSLDLQFALDKTLTARKGPTPVFVRGSAATFVDGDGLIKYGAENLSFSFTSYSKVQLQTPTSISDGVTVDSLRYTPTGTPTGYMFTSFTFVQATLVTLSCFVRSPNLTTFNFRDFASPAKNSRNFNPTTGSWAASGGDTQFTSYTALSFGNGWYRISCNYLPTDATSSRFFGVMIGQNAATSVDLGGMQIERFSTARTYIPTTTAAVYGPRFDHDPLTGVCKGLLMEESRTNIMPRSQDLTTGWTVTNLQTITSGFTSPSGDSTACSLVENNLSGIHSVQLASPSAVTAGSPYTASVYAKENGATSFQLVFSTTGLGAGYANFVLSGNGSIGTFNGVTATIERLSNGWYRCSMTVASAPGSGAGFSILVVALNNNNSSAARIPVYLGDNATGVFVWGAQLELGSFPTSYIPTTTASVIRSADVCSISGSAFSGFYNPLEGTMVTSASANGFTTNNNAMSAIELGVGNVIRIINRVAQGNRLSAIVSGVTLTPASNYNSLNVVYKTAVAANASGADYVIDGTQIPDVFTGSALTADNLKFSGIASSTSNNTILSFRYYRKRLPVAKLQSLTV